MSPTFALPSSLFFASLLLPLLTSASSPPAPFSKRATTALEALVAGPVTYVTTACTATCAPMVAQSTTCTEDVCSCAASSQTVTCMNCILSGEGTADEATVVQDGFAAYADDCVNQGLLAAVPALTVPVIPSSSSTSSSTSATQTTSSRTSSSSPIVAATTSAAVGTAGTTTGLAAITAWYTLVDGACPANCATVQADIAACTDDTCVCTQAIFNDGQTCQTQCVVNNIQGGFTSSQQTSIASLWTRAQSACGITAAGAAASTATATSRASTATKIPQQSYYAATTTTSAATTSGVIAKATGASTGGASPKKSTSGAWVALFGAVGAVLLA